jgi:hypothetical protein
VPIASTSKAGSSATATHAAEMGEGLVPRHTKSVFKSIAHRWSSAPLCPQISRAMVAVWIGLSSRVVIGCATPIISPFLLRARRGAARALGPNGSRVARLRSKLLPSRRRVTSSLHRGHAAQSTASG